ncbi:hypothetical protein AAHC03_026670 [Spirometra sp. Aus1]
MCKIFQKEQEKKIKRLALEEKKRCRRLQLESGYEGIHVLGKPSKARHHETPTKSDWMKDREPGNIPQPSLMQQKEPEVQFVQY